MPRGVPKNVRKCGGAECDRTLRAGWPHKLCATCRALSGDDESAGSEEASEKPDVLDVIESFGLDYMTGNAARFLLEYRDGDELTNLETAKTYLERAIASRTPR